VADAAGGADYGRRRLDGVSDEVLADQVKRGDGAALEQLVERYLRRVHAVVASCLSEQADVEDAVQETFMRVVRSIGGYDGRRAFAPWLYQIARNAARDCLGSAVRQQELVLGSGREPVTAPVPPDLATERRELRRLVSEAIRALPEQQRTAFRLHDVEGYAGAEVAALMGVTAGTVRSHVHHARRAVRAALAVSAHDYLSPEGGEQ
jgi:RNA polymerase sigma-70 factor, ECF subfamily